MIAPILVGVALAIGTVGVVHGARLERRTSYALVGIIVASYYALFGAIGGESHVLLTEVSIGLVFAIMSVAGFRFDMSYVALALVLHGVFDVTHGHFISNAGMPAFWPAFCASYDIALGLLLGLFLAKARVRRKPEVQQVGPRG